MLMILMLETNRSTKTHFPLSPRVTAIPAIAHSVVTNYTEDCALNSGSLGAGVQ